MCVKYIPQGLCIILFHTQVSFLPLSWLVFLAQSCHLSCLSHTPFCHYHLQPSGFSSGSPDLMGLAHQPSWPACQSPPLRAEEEWHQLFPLSPIWSLWTVLSHKYFSWAFLWLLPGWWTLRGLGWECGGGAPKPGLAGERALEGRVQAWPRASACCSSSEGCYSACLPSPRPLRAAPAVFQAQSCPEQCLSWVDCYISLGLHFNNCNR